MLQDTTKQFNKLQQCTIDQYANYFVEDDRGKKYYVKVRVPACSLISLVN